MIEQYMVKMLSPYYENEAKKLHTIVDKIFNRYYGGIYGKDMDEFYGVATDALIEIGENETYDSSKGDFDGYVFNALKMAFIDEFKKQNRDKRTTKIFLLDDNGNNVLDDKTGKPIKISIPDARLDAPLKDGENITLGDTIPSNFNMDDIFDSSDCKKDYSPQMVNYLSKLSKIQIKVLVLLADGYKQDEIIDKLDIDSKLYADSIAAIKSYRNTKCISKLFRRNEKNVR